MNANGHAHGRAGVEVIVIKRMRVSDDAGGDAAAFAVFCAVRDGEMEFMAFLGRDGVAVTLNVAVNDGLKKIERSNGDAFDSDGLVVGEEPGFHEANPCFVVALR